MFSASAAASGPAHAGMFPPPPSHPPAAGPNHAAAHVAYMPHAVSAGSYVPATAQVAPTNMPAATLVAPSNMPAAALVAPTNGQGGQALLHVEHVGAQGGAEATEKVDTQFLVSEPCKLCALLGRDAAQRHEFKDCYANPRSTKCQLKAWRARMGDMIYQGIKIPDYMLDPPGTVQGDQVDTSGVVKREDRARPK